MVEIGMTVDSLYSRVGREYAKLVDLSLEGFFTPAFEVSLNREEMGKPSLVAEIGGPEGCDIVSRTTVYDSRFRTDEGIHVGSTLGEIREKYNIDWIGFGEGTLFARVDKIGMSFGLDYVHPSREWYKTRDQALIPDSTKVVSIFVVN